MDSAQGLEYVHSSTNSIFQLYEISERVQVLAALLQGQLDSLKLLPEVLVGFLRMLVLKHLELRRTLLVLQNYFFLAVGVALKTKVRVLGCGKEGHLLVAVVKVVGAQPPIQLEAGRSGF